MSARRVLVCGGRSYGNSTRLWGVLDAFHDAYGIACVITGGADGADELAERWARGFFPIIIEKADWDTHGRAAGPIRNQKMLNVHKPDVVIAFSGGRGTHDMKERARKAGVPAFEGDDCAFTDAAKLVASWRVPSAGPTQTGPREQTE